MSLNPIRRMGCVAALAALLSVAPVAHALRLGVINERPDRPSAALEQFDDLHQYLNERLAERGLVADDSGAGELVITRDLDEMQARIAAGEVDALLEGVLTSLTLQRRTGQVQPRLLVWRKGQRQYHTVFFVRHDSPIQRLEHLRGRRIAFEAPRSTSAYAVPYAELLNAGLRLAPLAEGAVAPSDGLVRYLFAGSELNQAYWVHSGRADVGAFNDGDWQRVPATIRADLRIIHTTRSVLRWLFSFVGTPPAALQEAVVEILLAMHQDPRGAAALQRASGIAKLEALNADDWENLEYWSHALGQVESAPQRP